MQLQADSSVIILSSCRSSLLFCNVVVPTGDNARGRARQVDAALDLSHTQNIGHMIKTHFPFSQFIVVSLKEGMFNNANVIFRTKFMDGVSTVTRTANEARRCTTPYAATLPEPLPCATFSCTPDGNRPAGGSLQG
jgi:hypothetical protein